MRKEYNDRQRAKLVNPGFTMAEYEVSKALTDRPKHDASKDAKASLELMAAFERHTSDIGKEWTKLVLPASCASCGQSEYHASFCGRES